MNGAEARCGPISSVTSGSMSPYTVNFTLSCEFLYTGCNGNFGCCITWISTFLSELLTLYVIQIQTDDIIPFSLKKLWVREFFLKSAMKHIAPLSLFVGGLRLFDNLA